jgi:hypothetical protein
MSNHLLLPSDGTNLQAIPRAKELIFEEHSNDKLHLDGISYT